MHKHSTVRCKLHLLHRQLILNIDLKGVAVATIPELVLVSHPSAFQQLPPLCDKVTEQKTVQVSGESAAHVQHGTAPAQVPAYIACRAQHHRTGSYRLA